MPASVRLAWLAAAVALSGCAATAPRAPSTLAPFPFEIMRVLDGDVAEAEIARLAPVERTTVPNRHVADATVTYRTYLFDRTRVTFLDARPVSRLFIESVETWDPAVRTPAGIGVGSTRTQVQAAYGERASWSDARQSVHAYRDADGRWADRLSVAVAYGEDDRARTVELIWDID